MAVGTLDEGSDTVSESFYGVICTWLGMAECGVLLALVRRLEKRRRASTDVFFVICGLAIGLSGGILARFLTWVI